VVDADDRFFGGLSNELAGLELPIALMHSEPEHFHWLGLDDAEERVMRGGDSKSATREFPKRHEHSAQPSSLSGDTGSSGHLEHALAATRMVCAAASTRERSPRAATRHPPPPVPDCAPYCPRRPSCRPGARVLGR
jgi:hypothetical protein